MRSGRIAARPPGGTRQRGEGGGDEKKSPVSDYLVEICIFATVLWLY